MPSLTGNRCRKAALLALAVGTLSASLVHPDAFGQVLSWDASGVTPAVPADGSGNWNTTTDSLWSNGAADSVWVSGDVASIGNGGTAGVITINDASGSVTANGINFNAVSSGSYTIGASGADTLTLAGGGSIGFTGASATISAPIAGAVGLNAFGTTGVLALSGSNAFTGTVAINSGTLVLANNSALGGTTNTVSLGTVNVPTSSTDFTGALVISDNISATAGSFRASANNANATSTLSIGNNAKLTITSNNPLNGLNSSINAAFIVGTINTAPVPATPFPVTTKLIVNPGAAQPTGSLIVSGVSNNSSFVIGVGSTNTSADIETISVDMTNLANFSFTTGTGAIPASGGNEFAIGHGSGTQSTVSFGPTSTVTAGVITIGDGSITAGLTTSAIPSAPTTTAFLNLGSALTTLNAANIIVGNYRAQGTVQWASATTTGSLTVNGATGPGSLANLTMGIHNSGSAPSSPSILSLFGHSVTFNGNNVVLGLLAGGTTASASSGRGGEIDFDTGAFNIASLSLAVATSGGGTGPINGTFALGKSNSSTGVLTVQNAANPSLTQFLIASNQGGTSNSKGTFQIKGGTANIYCNIIDNSTVNTSNTLLSVSGGTLNMNGFAIGPITASGNSGAVGTRKIASIAFSGTNAVLANLGGTGINDLGLSLTATTANATTLLTLEGSNSYTGGTTISTGTLQVGQSTDPIAIPLPLGAIAGNVTNTANLNFGSANAITVQNVIGGTGTVNQTGNGSTTLAANNTYNGVTSVNNGKLVVTSLAAGGISSPIGSSSYAASNLVLSGGTLQYTGSGSTTDRLFTVTPTGGTIDSSGSGALVFNNGGAILSADAGQRTSATTTAAGTKLNFNNVADLLVGMTVTGTNVPANTSIISINSNANSITLNNTVSFIGAYTVNFSPANRSLTLTGTNVNANIMGNSLSDTAAGATLSVTKSGAGSWSLTASNSYTGVTTVTGGTLTAVGSAAWSPALANSNITGGRLVFDYNSDSSPGAITVGPALKNSYPTNFTTGPIQSSSANSSKGLGWKDDTTAKKVTVMYTYYGDADLDGQVAPSDFVLLGQNFNSAGTWATGDFNYDGVVNALDFNALATNFGSPALPSPPALGTLVPEPGSLALLTIAAIPLLKRRSRGRKHGD